MALGLRKLLLSDEDLVAGIDLDENQKQFSGGEAKEIFARLRECPFPCAVHPFIFGDDQNTVGFFVLRQAPALPVWGLQGAMTLHNFRIGRKFQRRGFGAPMVGKAAQWAAKNQPGVLRLMLSVNDENKAAAALYQRCGFRPTGARIDGRVGPETIMEATIAAIVGT